MQRTPQNPTPTEEVSMFHIAINSVGSVHRLTGYGTPGNYRAIRYRSLESSSSPATFRRNQETLQARRREEGLR
jgi:hypothetical protein